MYHSNTANTANTLQPVSIWPRNCISLQLSQTVVIWWKLRVLKGGQIESRLAGQERVAHCHTSGSPQNHPNTYPWSKLACKARTNSYGSSGNSRCRKHAKSSGTAVFCDQWSWFCKHPTLVTSWDDSNNSNTVICGILIDICNITRGFLDLAHQLYGQNSRQFESNDLQDLRSQAQDERATQHAVNKATPSIANLVNHFGRDIRDYGTYLTHNWECKRGITSSIWLQSNSHCPKTWWWIQSLISRFLLSLLTIHVEQSTTRRLWPTKQDGRQPFNTREVGTSRQNAIHHQASQNHLGTNMSHTVHINYINSIARLIYMHICAYIYIYTECIHSHLIDRRPTAFTARKWRAILDGFRPNNFWFSPTNHSRAQPSFQTSFLGWRIGFGQSILKDFAQEQHQNAGRSWSSSYQSGKMVLLRLQRCQNQRLKSEDSAIQLVILKTPGHM